MNGLTFSTVQKILVIRLQILTPARCLISSRMVNAFGVRQEKVFVSTKDELFSGSVNGALIPKHQIGLTSFSFPATSSFSSLGGEHFSDVACKPKKNSLMHYHFLSKGLLVDFSSLHFSQPWFHEKCYLRLPDVLLYLTRRIFIMCERLFP